MSELLIVILISFAFHIVLYCSILYRYNHCLVAFEINIYLSILSFWQLQQPLSIDHHNDTDDHLGWSVTMLQVTKSTFSGDNSEWCGHHQTLVADLADDISHVFANQDSSLLDNTGEFNHARSLFVTQAGDLGCFKCPSCTSPQFGIRNTSASALSPPGPSRAVLEPDATSHLNHNGTDTKRTYPCQQVFLLGPTGVNSC